MTMWHYTHIGGIIQRGPGLIMIEATAITPEGELILRYCLRDSIFL